jgi:molybdopterin/thiamine biosynthesis adenylyltransferase
MRLRGSASLAYAGPMNLDFNEEEIARYSRHIVLAEVGGIGQAKLRDASVLVVGTGGLGSPLVLYLTAAGVGRIGIVDDDAVELSNLQRQIAHNTERLGMPKTASAAAAARALNPNVHIEAHQVRITPANALELVAGYDIVCDGTDNFATRFLVADACVLARRTLVSAAVLRFEGQLSVFKPHAGGPCYRCLYPAPPPSGMVPTCSEAGILGVVAGVMGTLQATEVLKEILGIGESMAGRLLIWDALATAFRMVRLRPDPDCAACGTNATLHDLSAHNSTEGLACVI